MNKPLSPGRHNMPRNEQGIAPHKRARGRRNAVVMIVLATMSASVAAQPSPAPATRVESTWILQRIARPAPVRTPFLELRNSPMLKAPLRIRGEYVRPREDTLVREVRSPYDETTTIRAGEASIARSGKPVRKFSLARVPELAQLQAGFGALLAGDRSALERDYRLVAQGTQQRWTLVLTPKQSATAARLRDITLFGQGAELRCIETQPTRGELQRTLLASAARAAATVNDNAALTALCRNGVQPR